MRKSRPEEADLHISVLGVVPAGPRWRNITARGREARAAARGLSEACLLGRLCLPVSWEMRLLLRTCTSCRERTSHRKVLPRFQGGGGRGGEQSGLPASPVFPNSSAGPHMFNMQGAVSGGMCPEPLGFFPLTWSTVSICAAPRTPPRLFSQPPAVRHKLAAG